MEKLSRSQASKRYLDGKFGKIEPLSEEMEIKLEEASKAANERISKNDVVYKSSNNRSHLYPTSKSSNSDCVLAMDFSKLDQHMKDWEDQRDKKGNIYKAFSEYILCLENSLEHEDDSYRRYLIEEEIKKLKKEQKKYYVPSMLEIAAYDRKNTETSKDSLEKSSFSLVKKFIKKQYKNRKSGNDNGESSIN